MEFCFVTENDMSTHGFSKETWHVLALLIPQTRGEQKTEIATASKTGTLSICFFAFELVIVNEFRKQKMFERRGVARFRKIVGWYSLKR